jgi:hypothetical protein
MEEFVIRINWVYFLGILGSLIAVAWYSSSRFSTIETDIRWLKKLVSEVKKKVDDIKIESENENTKAFASSSPVKLTPRGDELLKDSGLKEYIDNHRHELTTHCKSKKCANAYEVQECVFSYFESMKFEGKFDTRLKDFAYKQGLSMDIMRRIGAIYGRDVCLDEFNMDAKDIDKHTPENS